MSKLRTKTKTKPKTVKVSIHHWSERDVGIRIDFKRPNDAIDDAIVAGLNANHGYQPFSDAGGFDEELGAWLVESWAWPLVASHLQSAGVKIVGRI